MKQRVGVPAIWLIGCFIGCASGAASADSGPGGTAASGSDPEACEFQVADCEIRLDSWPKSGFRVGLAAFSGANMGSIWNLYPHRVRKKGVSVDLDEAFGIEMSWGLPGRVGGPETRAGFLWAPFAYMHSTEWPTGKSEPTGHYGGTLYGMIEFRGICLTAGFGGYRLGRSFDEALGNWDNTAFGLGLILARIPEWGGRWFMPELMHWIAK